jgi:hypothetical protein
VARCKWQSPDFYRKNDGTDETGELREPADRHYDRGSEVLYEPFTVRVNHRIMVNTDLIEFVCQENEKSSQYFDK